MATIKKGLKKAQNGTTTTKTTIRPGATKDSTDFFIKKSEKFSDMGLKQANVKDFDGWRKYSKIGRQAIDDMIRQNHKAEKGYDKNGYPLKNKKKMKNGGSLTSLKASNKRVGPVDPKGAFTKVQKKTLAGAKGKASLTKDKQLGATKMAKSGAKVSKKK